MPRLPNFFIAGAPKTGTTSLYAYLDQHPQIYMSPIKEPCYFASEIRPENMEPGRRARAQEKARSLRNYLDGPMEKRFGGMVTEWDDYLKLFRNVTDETAIGEASVCYLWSQSAAGNIAARVPGARIVIVLRNPADRAFSHYLHLLSMGAISRSFRQQIQASLRSSARSFSPLWPFLELGLYYEQVRRFLGAFPHERVRIYLYEEYQQQPKQMLADLLGFLGVDPALAPDKEMRLLEPRVPRLAGPAYVLKKWRLWKSGDALTPRRGESLFTKLAFRPRSSLVMELADRSFLNDYYRDDLKKLSGLLGRDLSGWAE